MDLSAAGSLDDLASGFEHAPAVLGIWEGPDLVTVAINRRGRDVLPQARIGRPLAEGHTEMELQYLQHAREVYRTGRPVSGREWRAQVARPDGTFADYWFDFDYVPWYADDGTVRGVVAHACDVTGQVQARRAAETRTKLATRRLQRAHDTVLQLQRALLPPGVPILPGLRIAARYVLADEDTAAGGDWYDVVPVAGGAVALVVGDVVGHGVEASTIMGQLRTVVRERLIAGAGLADAVGAADRYASVLAGAGATTVCAAVLDPATGELEYASAGHPPILVVRADGTAAYLTAATGGPLGTGDGVGRGFRTGRERLATEDLLLLYTDGLVERPGRTPAQSTVQLSQIAAGTARNEAMPADHYDTDVDRVCAQTIELLVRDTGFTDDITLLAVQRTTPAEPFEARADAVAYAVPDLRARLDDWLTGLGADVVDSLALRHAVGELVSNAAEHAYRDAAEPGPVEVRAELLPTGAVEVTVADHGVWAERPAAEPGDEHAWPPRGHGLALARSLVDDLRIQRGPRGTTGRLSKTLTHAVPLLTPWTRRAGTRPDSGRDAGAFRAEIVPGDGAGPEPRVVLAGPLELPVRADLRTALLRVTRGGTRSAVADLDAVTILSSCAVQVLHEALAATAANGAELRLVAAPGTPAQHVLSLVRLPHDSGLPEPLA